MYERGDRPSRPAIGRWADQTEPDRREIAADPRKPKITPHKTALFEVPICFFVNYISIYVVITRADKKTIRRYSGGGYHLFYELFLRFIKDSTIFACLNEIARENDYVNYCSGGSFPLNVFQ